MISEGNLNIESNSEYNDLKANNQEKNLDKVALNSQHVLNSSWVFWYISRKEKDHNVPYEERLKKISSFSTLEEFFKYYVFLKSASEVDRNSDLSLFKEGFKPLWESCPDGGCWFVRFKKNDNNSNLDLIWEKLLFALIGEQFEEPNLLGTVLSIRNRETIIEVWFDYKKNNDIKSYVLEKFKELIDIDPSVTVYFKETEQSLKDKSTLKNAETYNINLNKRNSNFQ